LNPDLEKRCDEIRATLKCGLSPVDVVKIAQEENIELAPGDYGMGFDGRIEYLPRDKRFVIYHPMRDPLSDPRVRFSIAHEMGHYYIEHHREKLLDGAHHDSLIGFRSSEQMEREADEFAASLLIPCSTLDGYIKRKGFMTFGEIFRASDLLAVSLTAAAIRYARYAEEPCAIVMSENNKILYFISSDEMKAIGLGFMKRGVEIPTLSTARKLLATSVHRTIIERPASSDEWYSDHWKSVNLWEEAMSLGYQGQVVTLLSIQKR